ncbi:flagellar hook-associated protein 3 FlgL [Clostridium sp. DSM 8431]|uniref:flagellar hook-associated protein FlgL n=1 Tax=Clostridium sp. DSM 8431 TaxID=1761781 RepID=UPI0008E2EC8B|nr:flagellar hook-associated protein FlgL [Clostridium sp. DSM 8431]SFU52064.1 flagellar hook-associated protein 3 FlgL [Clostridium sp. DSM 8431]
MNSRITNRMISNNYLSNMKRNLFNLNTINNQLSTGKLINRPSDNPYKTARSMQLTTSINSNAQYKTNIEDASNWLDATDDALSSLTNVVQRVRELMVSSGNAAYGSDESKSIAKEISERVSEITQILNTNFDGRYIFGGTKTTSKPVEATSDLDRGTYSINFIDKDGKIIDTDSTDYKQNILTEALSSKIGIEVSKGVNIDYNVTAMGVLKFRSDKGEYVDGLKLFDEIQNNLLSGDMADREEVVKENLTDLDSLISNILNLRSEVGAKQNRLESAGSKNRDETLNMTDVLSRTEDVDYTEKTIEYYQAQTTYTAALQVNAQILPKTLLDYL